ncbi:MAG: hypothetical protein KDA52_12530, partial [Planctomycetaceae bacterium]|nr:hypothetical protein [Planctomycetaceae bacterium]
DGQPLEFVRVTSEGRKVPIDVWPCFNSPYFDEERQVFRLWHRVSLGDASRDDDDANLSTEDIGVGVGYQRAYSESTDGIHFELKAFLKGLTDYGDVNLVVTVDEHESDPDHYYKIGYDCAGNVCAAAIAHSVDGIHWMPYNDGKPVTYRAADFPNQVYWDPQVEAYRLLTRTDFGAGGGPFADTVKVPIGDHNLEVRGMRTMLNRDLKGDPTAWTLERHWLFDGEERIATDRPPIGELIKDPAYVVRLEREAMRRQLYMMTDWFYQGVHIGLLSALEYPTDVSEGVEEDFVTRHERSIENMYIATCRDGISWDWHWVYAGEPLVPRGPAGSWDKDMVFPPTHLITHQDRHWIYYGGTNERHGCAEKDVWFTREGHIGLAWLRQDGFVSLTASGETGLMTTKPFMLKGPRLELNLVTQAGGTVRVEVLDSEGEPIAGYSGDDAPVFTDLDDLHWQPTWSSPADLSSLVGRPIRLRIHLEDASLYAFEVLPES